MYIEKIKSPADLKGLDIEALNIVADETRRAVLNRVSKHGGHIGPNLGFVEATVALHYVFNAPKDKFVFDVSHQCYPHKGYEVKPRYDRQRKLVGYTVGKNASVFKASEIGRKFMASKIEDTWKKLHPQPTQV